MSSAVPSHSPARLVPQVSNPPLTRVFPPHPLSHQPQHGLRHSPIRLDSHPTQDRVPERRQLCFLANRGPRKLCCRPRRHEKWFTRTPRTPGPAGPCAPRTPRPVFLNLTSKCFLYFIPIGLFLGLFFSFVTIL